jgi:hypothetical protein
MLLACDLFLFGYQPAFDVDLQDRISTFSIDTIESNKAEDGNISSACIVMVGSLAAMDPPKLLRDRIINLIVQRNASDPVLDGSFCKLVQLLSEDELETVLRNIIVNMAESEAQLRLVLLLFRYLKDANQIQVLAKLGRDLFSSTVTQLSKPLGPSNSVGSLDVALTVVNNLIRRRDIVEFREFDLAVILSHISSVLGTLEQGATSAISPSTYSICATVLASMFQRYSILLYACVPSVISVYYVLLSHAMYGSEAPEISRGFVRVCELLIVHKTVYKKHVLGLVLEFVHGIGDLSLERRERLIPSVYYLLDVMSTYEMQQLNATMDSKHKILFRTIYRGYQKVHSYKGQ